ncbi:hypothetical protein KKH38_01790 [Patescibacteria group bacterium]|nr:hypothetical protein [Patescibacteria group bacterium]MBU4601319.1 hypothetical protein [Patescibacteria group bacterium]MCG2698628.1 hypothetical protein [Candidatus Parcubacteria bacterium]
MADANSQTLTPQEQIDMAGQSGEKSKNSAFNPMNDVDAQRDAGYQSRLREARQKAKDSKLKDMGKTGRKIGKMAAQKVKKKIAQGSDNIFYVLLFIALIVDLLEYLDLGIFSSLANVGIYILVIVSGFVMYIFKNSSNKFSIFNLLKGQLWKYAVLPIFEMFPLINLFPFWTGTVILMWLKVKRERKKIIIQEEKEEKTSEENLQPEYA